MSNPSSPRSSRCRPVSSPLANRDAYKKTGPHSPPLVAQATASSQPHYKESEAASYFPPPDSRRKREDLGNIANVGQPGRQVDTSQPQPQNLHLMAADATALSPKSGPEPDRTTAVFAENAHNAFDAAFSDQAPALRHTFSTMDHHAPITIPSPKAPLIDRRLNAAVELSRPMSSHSSGSAAASAIMHHRHGSDFTGASTGTPPPPNLLFNDGQARERRRSSFRQPLESPCYFHQRFRESINIGRVVDEIEADESMSHSRLMATATGVREVSRQLLRRQVKMDARHIMIVTKPGDKGLISMTRQLAEWLLLTPRYGLSRGVTVYVDGKMKNSRLFDTKGLLAKDPQVENMLKFWTPEICSSRPERFDLVLTLGGDGTVLFTSWLFQHVVPPVMPFSLGSLGFLAPFEFSEFKNSLNHVMGDAGINVNLRMRFTCTVFRASKNPSEVIGIPEKETFEEQFEVLNELVIDRGPSAYISNLELYSDGDLLTVIQADGCILSTPTGSTAYSLSAGGSLLHPSIPAILLTPICPHTLSFRPMVLSDSASLRIAVPRNSRSSAFCSFDGKGRVELRRGDYVTVEASQYPFPTVSSGPDEWFTSVRRALRWNTRGASQKELATSEDDDNDDASADDDEHELELELGDEDQYGSDDNCSDMNAADVLGQLKDHHQTEEYPDDCAIVSRPPSSQSFQHRDIHPNRDINGNFIFPDPRFTPLISESPSQTDSTSNTACTTSTQPTSVSQSVSPVRNGVKD